MVLKVKRMRDTARLPTYATSGSAGMDLCANIENPIAIQPGETEKIPTGIAMAISENYVGIIAARSGLSIKHGIAPANKIGVIDSDYRGEIIVALHNHTQSDELSQTYTISPGERIAQLLIVPVVQADITEVDKLDETVRGEGGFGSTGKQ